MIHYDNYFEYLVKEIPISNNASESQTELDNIGYDNWELVSVMRNPEFAVIQYTFKRLAERMRDE